MRCLICATFALSLLGGTAAVADDYGHDRNDQQGYGQNRNGDQGQDYNRYDQRHQHDRAHWSRGDRFSGHYVGVDDWRGRHLRRPPRGYHWVQNDDGDYILMAVTTGIIMDLMLNSQRGDERRDEHR